MDPTANDNEQKSWFAAANIPQTDEHSRLVEQLGQLQIPRDLLAVLWSQLPPAVAILDDPAAGLSHLVQFLSGCRSPHGMLTLFERDTKALPSLLHSMAIGPNVAKILIDDPEAFELLRITDGQPVARQVLLDEVRAEVLMARDDRQASRTLHRYRQRETLRIAYGELVRQVPTDVTGQQLAILAESILRAAFDFAYRETVAKLGEPKKPDGDPARCGCLAFDRFGSGQMDFTDRLSIMLLAETNGRTQSTRLVANTDFFDRLAHTFRELVTGEIDGQPIYRLQFLKPHTLRSDSSVVDVEVAFQHFDLRGRTVERIAFVQASPVAGDDALGHGLLQRLQPWIYRRYWNDADVAGLAARQRILHRSLVDQAPNADGPGVEASTAREIEQACLCLQLLHGHEFPTVRIANTCEALDRLASLKILPPDEHQLLRSGYAQLRLAEDIRHLRGASPVPSPGSNHRGRTSETRRPSSAIPQDETASIVERIRMALSHRLQAAFSTWQEVSEESDLVLASDPDPSWIDRLLKQYRFAKPREAYLFLTQMAEEEVTVLSTRRCRYFLSLIAPDLLATLSETPNPDATLANLARMSGSLGGKGVLWELLASSPPTMKLIVRLCAGSPYLIGLLTQSPGMIDELMDSLWLDRLPHEAELEEILEKLCRRTDDIDRTIHEFKNSMHLRVGVRDILGKDPILDTHRALANIAEVALKRLIDSEYKLLSNLYGTPFAADRRTPLSYTFLALGKLGGQEPNYHSDLSLVLLFDEDGNTHHEGSSRGAETTTGRHFFEQLAQRVMRRANRPGKYGRLYELDVRFGPLGKSGVLAMQLEPFIGYFQRGQATIGERLSLCKARPIAGSLPFRELAFQRVLQLLQQQRFTAADRDAILHERSLIQSKAMTQNLKRGIGGTGDVETLIQVLQLEHAAANPQVLVPGTLEAIRRLESAGILDRDEAKRLYDGYHLLREVESGLRLMNTAARHDLPDHPEDLKSLAYLLRRSSEVELREQVIKVREDIRAIFDRRFRIVSPSPNARPSRVTS